MMRRLKSAVTSAAVLVMLGAGARAEQVFTEDVVIDGGLCAGEECASGNAIATGVRIKSTFPNLKFENSYYSGNAGDWSITTSYLGSNRFGIGDDEFGTLPFAIQGGASSNTLYLRNNGSVGMGTSFPEKKLHLITHENTALRLEQDTGGGFGSHVWDITSGDGGYQLSHNEASVPFTIANAAPSSGFVMDSAGNVGFGTMLPQHELHVVDGAGAVLRLEQDSSGGFGAHTWDLSVGDSGFLLSDVGLIFSTVPFRVENGASNSALILSSNGNIGMGPGAAVPDATLHVARNSGNAQIKVEEVNGTQTARALVNLVNNGRPDIVMANTGTGKEWAFGAGSNFVLKTGAVGSTDAEKTLHLKLFGATGNLEITGQIITGGGSCGGGCDRVFSPDYKLPSIAEHAKAMYALGHLPNMGPMPEGEPFNLSDKFGRLLNEVEHAHIYIAQQQAMFAELRAENAALRARLDVLEAAQ